MTTQMPRPLDWVDSSNAFLGAVLQPPKPLLGLPLGREGAETQGLPQPCFSLRKH